MGLSDFPDSKVMAQGPRDGSTVLDPMQYSQSAVKNKPGHGRGLSIEIEDGSAQMPAAISGKYSNKVGKDHRES